MLAPVGASSCSDIKNSLRHLYLDDPRPWLAGVSGGTQSPVCGPSIRASDKVLVTRQGLKRARGRSVLG